LLFRVKEQKQLLIADGLHRLRGAAKSGLKTLACTVRQGTCDECYLEALKANRTHGLRRSNEDKRVVIETAIKRFSTMSDHQLSITCAVSDHTVADVRKLLESNGEIAAHEKRTDSVGRKQPSVKEKSSQTETFANANVDLRDQHEDSLSSQTAQHTEGKAHKQLICDAEGTPIPKSALKYWARRGEFKDLLADVNQLRDRILSLGENRDPLFRSIKYDRLNDSFSDIYHNIEAAAPYAVCTDCQGHPEIKPGGHCQTCGVTGLITKSAWDTCTKIEVRELRRKANEERLAKEG